MTTSLGGPREGMCTARQFTCQPLGACKDDFDVIDEKQLGVMPWAELISMVEQAGGSRPTFDLFDLPANPDGTWTRIRAVEEGMTP